MTTKQTILSFIYTLLLFCSTALSAYAAKAGFSWLPNNEPDLTGYKIHYGTTSRSYNVVVDVGLPNIVDGRAQAEIDGLQQGQTYFFAATAFNDTGDSDYSTEVEYTVPSVDIQIIQMKLLSSTP